MYNISDILINTCLCQTYEECLKKYPGGLSAKKYSLSEDGKVMSKISQAIDGPLVVPEGVEIVDFEGPYCNEELTAFILPDSVKEMKGSINGCFCKRLEFMRLSLNMSLPKMAFADCPLKAVLIPEGIKIIPKEAFRDNEIIELRLSESLEFIMKDAFKNNKELEEIVIPRNVKVIMPSAFEGCDELKKVTVISPETIIFPGAFRYCKELGEDVEKVLYEKHKVGDREIGADEVVYTEEECKICGKTVISKVLKYVPDYFCGELIIEEVTNKTDYNGANLRDIEGITKLYIPDSMVENIPNLPPHVKEVRFPDSMEGLKEFRRNLKVHSDSLVSFNFPKGLQKLNISNAQLTELKIPESVKEVEIHHMPKIKKLVLPSSLEKLYLSDLPSLTDLTIQRGVLRLGNGFGRQCDNLNNVTLPDTLETIGENAFYGCKKLSKIVIPSSVKEIEQGAFSQCPNLTEVIMEGKPRIHPQAFVETPGYDVKVSGLATYDYDEDGIPLVNIDLVSVYAGSYDYAMSFDEEDNFISEQWGEGGIFMISKSRDIIRFPFDKIMYIDGSRDRTYDLLTELHGINENYCEEALSNAYVFYQDSDQCFSEEIWENTARALSIIFKPKPSGLRNSSESIEEKEYEGPEAIFKFKIYNENDINNWKGWETANPFFETRYRVFKNDKEEWTSQKLD